MSEHEVSKLAVFEGKRIRKTLHEGEWWFVVKDVVLALIESRDPKDPALFTRPAKTSRTVMNTRRRLRAAQRILLTDLAVTTKTEKAEDKRAQRADRKLDAALDGCRDRSYL